MKLKTVAFLGMLHSVNAASVMDAHYNPTTDWASSTTVGKRLSLAQTFTVLTSGFLASVDVFIARSNFNFLPNHPLQLDVRETAGGLPTEANTGSSILSLATVSPESVGTSFTWIKFTFPTAIPVESGDHLAIVLMSDTQGAEYQWAGDFSWPVWDMNDGTYPEGLGFTRGDSAARATDDPTPNNQWGGHYLNNTVDPPNNPDLVDFSFRTYVSSVPEPDTLVLVCFLSIGLLKRRNR